MRGDVFGRRLAREDQPKMLRHLHATEAKGIGGREEEGARSATRSLVPLAVGVPIRNVDESR